MNNAVKTFLLLGCFLLQSPAEFSRHRGTDDRRGGFPEGTAAIQGLVLHFDPSSAGALLPAWSDLARGLSRSVRLYVAVASPHHVDAASFLLRNAGLASRRCEILHLHGGAISIWARDRMIAVRSGSKLRLVTPRRDLVTEDRIGDLDVGRALAATVDNASVTASTLRFEGGDVLFCGDRVLLSSEFARVNGFDERDPNALARARKIFMVEPILISTPLGLPHDHLDMFLTVIDARTLLLGDPLPGARYLQDLANVGLDRELVPGFSSWTSQEQYSWAELYDLIHQQLVRKGFRVLRVPVLHGAGDAMLSWNNALVEAREDGRHAFVPVYGIPALDDLAVSVFERAGCRVWPVRATDLIKDGGAVRCITNVVDWDVPVTRQPSASREAAGRRR